MRIAISGAHNTGKSTLVEALAARLPAHVTVPEPYELLEEEGDTFAFPPTVDDYVRQLRRSLDILANPAPDLIMDRCPLDFLAYIAASRYRVAIDAVHLRDQIQVAMASLDLVVVTRIDPRHDPAVDTDRLRTLVDARLEELVINDALDLLDGIAVLPLYGPWDRRADVVIAWMKGERGSSSAP